jgi:2-polyprenyl-3-methyl-5-hydroxy-6-metoxy-1,4-benzoquinol methylase
MSRAKWSAYAEKRNLSRNRLLHAHHQEMLEDFLRLLSKLPTDQRILDVGPAGGLFMTLARELGFTSVQGVDASPVFVEVLRAKGLDAVVGDVVTRAGFEALAPPYDVVTMMEVLEHVEKPELALATVRSLLAPGGLLYLTVPICDSIFDRAARLFGSITRDEQVRAIDETHLHAFTTAELRAMLTSAGFPKLRVRRLSFRIGTKSRRPWDRWHLLARALLPQRARGLCVSVVAYTDENESPAPLGAKSPIPA